MRIHDCVNVFGACDGDWSDVDSLCDDCRIERESALIDAAMDADGYAVDDALVGPP